MIFVLNCFGLTTTFLLGFLVGMRTFNLLTGDLDVIFAFFRFSGVTPDLTSALRVCCGTVLSLSTNYCK